MSSTVLFEQLFQINFCQFICDKEAVQLFKTCKRTYYRIYPNYKFTTGYVVEVFLAFMDNDRPKMGCNSFNPRLTYILCRNIGHSGACSLAKALEVNKSITTIDLSYNQIGDLGASSLAKALEVNNSVTAIDLSRNQIGNPGAASLAKALEVNKNLLTIDLYCNHIGESGISLLGKALEVNKTITEISLGDNRIGAEHCLLVKH